MEEIEKIELRKLSIDDYEELRKSMVEAYGNWPGAHWEKKDIENLLRIFPEGQIVILVNGNLVGSALSLIVRYEHFGDDHTYNEIVGDGTFNTHNSKGDVLYGIDVFVKPEFRGLRLGRRLYDARKKLCEDLNLRAIMFGGRIPGYKAHSEEFSPKEYIQKVKYREIYDPILTFQLSNDFHVKKVLSNYQEGDEQSKEFAVLLEWDNIYYRKSSDKHIQPVVRLGLIQWQMRPYKSIDELFEQVEYFVDTVSGYQADFAVFPEYFNAPLLTNYNHLEAPAAFREIAAHTEEIRDRFVQLAISYNVNIIAGSMPLLRDDMLYNAGYLCRRNGTWDEYIKLHITPDELRSVGLRGGDKIQVFNTDCGTIGILICYDVEFPELARIMTEKGMKILFVPFLTDTQNGYARVRNCARARAIENECYVAITGSVGNLPRVHNMDIQFSQSAVFTPCDFSFPVDGIRGESTPNTETILVVDVDLDLLKELHLQGSVQNIKDRRTDLYEIKVRK